MPTSQIFESPPFMQPVSFYYQIIRDVCSDLGCAMVPVDSCWKGMMIEKGLAYSDLLQKDLLYPNERGHEIFAEVIMQRLEQIVPSRIKVV